MLLSIFYKRALVVVVEHVDCAREERIEWDQRQCLMEVVCAERRRKWASLDELVGGAGKRLISRSVVKCTQTQKIDEHADTMCRRNFAVVEENLIFFVRQFTDHSYNLI